MKPNQDKNRKLNLNKQTIQKLDSKKLSNVYAGQAQAAEAGTTSIAVSILAPEGSVICAITVAV